VSRQHVRPGECLPTRVVVGRRRRRHRPVRGPRYDGLLRTTRGTTSTAGYAAGTVLTYYAHVASWCGWAHAQGVHPAALRSARSDAEDPLPRTAAAPATNRRGSRSTATLITQFVDRRVSEAFGSARRDRGLPPTGATRERDVAWQAKQRARFKAYQRCREQALVYVVAYTGLRGSEFLPRRRRRTARGATGFAGVTCRSRTVA